MNIGNRKHVKHVMIPFLSLAIVASCSMCLWHKTAFAQDDVEPGTSVSAVSPADSNSALITEPRTSGGLSMTDMMSNAYAKASSSYSTKWGLRFASGQLNGNVEKGVDISVWDGSIDLSKARKDGVDFAIIRCGYGQNSSSQDDKYWISNMKKASNAGVKIGVYIYSYAKTTSAAKGEAKHVIRCLNEAKTAAGITAKDITLPIYYDVEDSSQSSLSSSTLKSICSAFAQTIKASDWSSCNVGVYSSRSWMQGKMSGITKYSYNGTSYKYSRWVAEYDGNTATTIHCLNTNSGSVLSPKGNYDIWQVCSSGKGINGIATNGIDIDFSYVDFAANLKGKMAKVTLSKTSMESTGKQLKPSVTVTYGKTDKFKLSKGTDYTVSYSNNVEPGTATVKVKGIGKYKGTVTKTFKITGTSKTVTTKNDLSGAEISAVPSQVYTGNAITPSISVSYNGKTLSLGTDYTVSYSNNIDAGTAKITITGAGDYTGTKETSFTIEKTSISSAKITVDDGGTYDATAKKPQVSVVLDGKTLTKETDYTVSYSDNTDAGTAKAIISGKGLYGGKATVSFKISKATLSDATVKVADAIYTGSKLTPSTKVILNGKTLSADSYSISYSDNVKAGTGKATITGKGNYKGTAEGSFKIARRDISEADVNKIPDKEYTGKAIKPSVSASFNGITLINGTDYSLSYSNNVKSGKASAILTGTGNFTGTKTVKFTIIDASANYCNDVLGAGSGVPYVINASCASGKSLDIGSNGNVQIWETNETYAQRWYVSFVKKNGNLGYYTIKKAGSSKYMKATGTSNKSNVLVSAGASDDLAKWTIQKTNGKYKITNLKSQKSLDVFGGVSDNGTNVWTYDPNTTSAQSFSFSKRGATVKNGTVSTIRSAKNSSYVLDVSNASKDNFANIQLWKSNSTNAQRFSFSYDEDTGYYTITNVGSKKAVDVSNGNDSNGSNVQQYSPNGTKAQKWTIKRNGDYYTIRNALGGRALDLCNGEVKNSSNIQIWEYNGTKAQKWSIG